MKNLIQLKNPGNSIMYSIVVVCWKLAIADKLTALLLADILYLQTVSQYESIAE